MVSWWPLQNDGRDIWGLSNGTLHNSPTFGAGKVGQALNVTGNNGVSVPDSPSLNFGPGADLSIDAWIRTSSTRTTLTVLDKRTIAGSNVHGYIIFLSTGSLRFQLGDGTAINSPNQGGELRDGQWHHIAVSIDRDQVNGGNLYVDGANVLVFNPTAVSGDLSNSSPLLIGEHVNDPSSSFVGDIDEVEIFNRALTGAEVASIFNAGSSGKCLPTVVDDDGQGDLYDCDSNVATFNTIQGAVTAVPAGKAE